MNTPLIVLATAALACAGAATHFYTQLADERERIEQLETRVAELQRAQSPDRSTSANPFLTAAPAGPTAPIEKAPSRPAPQPEPRLTANRVVLQTPPGRSEEERRALRERMMRERKVMMEDPEYRKAMRTQHRLNLRQHYPDLASDLGVTNEEADRFFDLLADQQLDGFDAVQDEGLDPSDPAQRQALERKFAQRQRAHERQIAELLGEDGLQRWQDYQQTMTSRMRARQLRDSFQAAGMPLREDQYSQLRTTLAERERQSRSERQNAFAAGPTGPTSVEQMLAAQESAITRTEQEYARSRDAVSHLLSFEQLEMYRQVQEAELAMQRAQLRLQRANMEAAMRAGAQDGAFFREAGIVSAQPIAE